MLSADIGIDLGTASILVYIKGKGVVLKEPSVVAFDKDTNKIKAIGEEARLMLGRTPGNIVAVRPLRQGVISDYRVTEKMLKYFIDKAVGRHMFRKPRISVCVPSGVTEVEKRAVVDATMQAGAREVSIIEEPIAAAIGAGIDISRPCGNMIVDIGGIDKAVGRHMFRKPRISVCVPSGVTEVEKRAVVDATMQAGAREVSIIEEPIAAAIGAGIDISRPCGNMIVDIGGGTTDIAVISLNATVVSASIKIAGDDFDEAIVRYMRKKHNLMIGERTAEEIKIKVGCAYPLPEVRTMTVKGRNLVTGLPKSIEITSDEMEEALREATGQIVEAVHSVLEKTPPELGADIADRGIVLTGGGSLLTGLEELIESKTGIQTVTAKDPMTAVAVGTGKYVEFMAGHRDRSDR